jgi:hypothetical protein
MAYNHADIRALFPRLSEGDISGGVQIRLQLYYSPAPMLFGIFASKELAIQPPALAALGTPLIGIGGIYPPKTDSMYEGLELHGLLNLRKKPMSLPKG